MRIRRIEASNIPQNKDNLCIDYDETLRGCYWGRCNGTGKFYGRKYAGRIKAVRRAICIKYFPRKNAQKLEAGLSSEPSKLDNL